MIKMSYKEIEQIFREYKRREQNSKLAFSLIVVFISVAWFFVSKEQLTNIIFEKPSTDIWYYFGVIIRTAILLLIVFILSNLVLLITKRVFSLLQLYFLNEDDVEISAYNQEMETGGPLHSYGNDRIKKTQ